MLSHIAFAFYISLLASSSHAADLLTTLRNHNASLFADVIGNDTVLSSIFISNDTKTIYAPVDSVFSAIPPSRRALMLRQNGDQDEQAGNSYHATREQSDASSERSVPGRVSETSSDLVPNRRGDPSRGQAIVSDTRPGDGGEGNQRRQTDTTSALRLFTGSGSSVNVIQPRIEYDGGSIYIIDGLFTIPSNLSTTLAARPDTAKFGTILGSSNLTAGLEAATGGTIFIPSSTALAANQSLSASAIQGHVIPGFNGYLPTLQNGQTLQAANGDILTVNITGQDYYINGAKIESSNLILENGVAHVVNQIISKAPSPTHLPPPQYTGKASSLRGSVGSVGAVAFGAVLATTFML